MSDEVKHVEGSVVDIPAGVFGPYPAMSLTREGKKWVWIIPAREEEVPDWSVGYGATKTVKKREQRMTFTDHAAREIDRLLFERAAIKSGKTIPAVADGWL